MSAIPQQLESVTVGVVSTIFFVFPSANSGLSARRELSVMEILFFSPGFGFFAYESVKDFILAMNGALTKVNKEDQAVLTPLGGLVCGAFAGASSQTVA